jgi:hypothetical protein
VKPPSEEIPAIEESKSELAEKEQETDLLTKGIDIEAILRAESIGFLSVKPVQPVGNVFSLEGGKMLVSKGDLVYVTVQDGQRMIPGEIYTIYEQSRELANPLTRNELGYVLTFLGKLAIKEQMNNFIFRAEVLETYREVEVGDYLIPYRSMPKCIDPAPKVDGFNTNIVAVHDLLQLIGEHSFVYLDHGYDHGVRRGQLYEVYETKKIDKPQKLELPEEVLGILLVVETTPEKSTALVINSQKEFHNGANARGIDWHQARDFISRVPRCP